MQRLGGVGGGGGALKELASGEKREMGGNKETWKWLKAKLEGEQMCPYLEMTDSPSLCHNQTKSKQMDDFVALRSSNLPQAGQAMHASSGLTRKACFTLSYGSAAVCKVEKNLRKTKVYEWLNSPVAC